MPKKAIKKKETKEEAKEKKKKEFDPQQQRHLEQLEWEKENARYVSDIKNWAGKRSIGGGHSWDDWN